MHQDPSEGSEFARLLAEIQERTGLSYQRIADIAGVNRSQVWRWANAGATPGYEPVRKLVAWLVAERPEVTGMAVQLLPAAGYEALPGSSPETERLVPAPPVLVPLSDDESDVAKLLEAAARIGLPVQGYYEQIMRTFRKVRDLFPPGEWPPGILIVEDARYADLWDEKAGQTFADNQPYTPSRLAFTVAAAQARDELERKKRRDSAAGLIPRAIP